jgi:hypothetical protein
LDRIHDFASVLTFGIDPLWARAVGENREQVLQGPETLQLATKATIGIKRVPILRVPGSRVDSKRKREDPSVEPVWGRVRSIIV